MINTINDFLESLKIRQYSEKTIHSYQCDLQQWLELCQNTNINSWQELNKQQIKKWTMKFNQQGVNTRSIRRYLSALKVFFDYLKERNEVKNNPVFGIKTAKINIPLPTQLAYGEIETLLDFTRKSKQSLRDTAIIEMLYGGALRVSELVSLDIQSLDFEAKFIKVLGKGNKERFVPLGAKAAIAIKKYINSRIDNNPALFLSQQQKRLSVRGVQFILDKIGISSPLGINIHPHMFRHSAATHLLQSSHDLNTTQLFLGHNSIKSTQVYTHLDFLDLADSYDNFHPLTKKQKSTKNNDKK
ncbi:Tyrosine recombinase XerC [hydrothermal vent metagenome]|uniref:Tyrosine recombinase XerC n=1 Tax=hydrothermal vent metagenome TaxID=652676 RepID=A0A1W1BYB2_9ZZZZ